MNQEIRDKEIGHLYEYIPEGISAYDVKCIKIVLYLAFMDGKSAAYRDCAAFDAQTITNGLQGKVGA
jgi:hypothetical protein